MREVDVVLEPLRGLLYQVGAFLPRLLLAAAILLVGWLLAKAARFAIDRALRAMNFHVVSEKAGIDPFLREGGGRIDTVGVLSLLVYWLIILVALMVAFNSLNLEYVTELISRVLLFVPRVMVAVLLLAFGAYFARFVGVAVARISARSESAEARAARALRDDGDHGVRRARRPRPAGAGGRRAADVPDPGRCGRVRARARVRARRPRSGRRIARSLAHGRARSDDKDDRPPPL